MTRFLLRTLQWLVIAVAVVAIASLLLRRCSRPAPRVNRPVALAPATGVPASPLCYDPHHADAARANAVSLPSLVFSPFRRTETGWEVYAPLIGHSLGTACPPDSPGFAASLAAWQGGHGLPADGRMDEPTFTRMLRDWYAQRPRLFMTHTCPDPPPESELVQLAPSESYGGMTVFLRGDALAAYRRMIAQARADLPSVKADPRLLTLFSGYRDPAGDDARCAAEGDCGTATRASCSPHRTGLAMDLFLGAAPGFRPDSSADPNRLYMSRTPEYRWLVANAGRFGFVNYPFEPWHWELRGAPASLPAPDAGRSSSPPRPATPPA